MAKTTKIYVIFLTTGLSHRGAWETEDMQRKVLSNQQILSEVVNACTGVEFAGRVSLVDEEPFDRVSRSHYGTTGKERQLRAQLSENAQDKLAAALAEIEQSVDLDGVLIFGAPPERLIQTGLPIIAVYPMWGDWMSNFDFQSYKGKKVVTSWLPVVPDASPARFARRIGDIAGKIRVIQALAEVRNLRILSVTDRPVMGSYETGYGDKKAYERQFLENMEQILGCTVITAEQERLFDGLATADSREAQTIADRWIEQAEGLQGTVREEVLKSAQLYLVMKALMEEYDCNAITTEGYGVFADYRKGPIPSQGLASSQLYTDGVTATSECLLNSLFTQHLGKRITGRPGFNGDYIIDPLNDIAVVGHCEGPFTPFGDEETRSPYVIRNLPRWKKNEGGASVQINYPVDHEVTVAKISVYDKKLALFAGTSVAGGPLFTDWDDLACRTKVAVKINTQALLANLDWQTFAVHRVLFYGNHLQRFQDFAALAGLDVVREDQDPERSSSR